MLVMSSTMYSKFLACCGTSTQELDFKIVNCVWKYGVNKANGSGIDI